MKPLHSITSLCLAGLLTWALSPVGILRGDDELARRATWNEPTPELVKSELDQWLTGQEVDQSVMDDITAMWAESPQLVGRDLLEFVIKAVARTNDAAAQLAAACQDARHSVTLPDASLLADQSLPPIVRNNLQLTYGIWLANHMLYNEALAQLDPLGPADVVDPESLLFYQGAVHYRLLEKEAGLAALSRLLERENEIPIRFANVAKLMQADLESLKTDSLDEVARLMDSIHVRLGHGRAGKRVRKEEDDVVAKLDKMIEKLEEQRRQQKQKQQSGSQGGRQSTQPLNDSQIAGGSGPGDVDAKKIDGPIDWGNLPPKERQEALQQLSKQFPSYYREVIEEYFRDLARKDVEADNP